MDILSPQLLYFLETILFATVLSMHLVKKNFVIISLYSLQSFIISILLFSATLREASLLLLGVAVATFFIKVIVAPYFFFRLIKKIRLHFLVSTYLNGPLILIVLALLTTFSHSQYFKPLTILAPGNENALLLTVGMIFISVFLIINRKGALSQMVGVLSLENAIVSFAFLAGLEQAPGPQLGIIFEIALWVVIATVFASMIYQQFGSLNVAAMVELKED
ncbi:hypothetical protein HY622_00410 [Candidatus Uhrbacteria bacterium]|nr:hypothetical protein [Candidatus Uhrbacteria bacterium]